MEDNARREDFEIEVMLHINNRLYEQKYITHEMYSKAKDMIIRRKRSKSIE